MNAPVTPPTVPPYHHTPLFPLGPDKTPYRKLEVDGVRGREGDGQGHAGGQPRGAARAGRGRLHRHQSSAAAGAPQAAAHDPRRPGGFRNDKFVAYDFLKNANIAAGGVLPMCQDTGTAIIMGKKGRLVFTDGATRRALAEGARDAYLKKNLRYSQLAPISMFEEKNTKSNMPAQVEIYAEGEDAYKFLFIAKGGGSANKSFLFQATPSILTHDRMLAFLKEKVLTLGTAACPPYHLAIVIGGTSAELTMKTVKLASTQLSRRAADQRQRGRPRLPRSRDGAGSAEDDAVDRRRRAVRRQIFLPRRARDPAAAAWRVVADRARRVVLGRPAGARQDHERRRVPRGARASSGAVSARGRSGEARRRRWSRSTSTSR